MTTPQDALVGADWTRLLSDPDLASHLGQLLRIYREVPPRQRNQALREAMLEIKRHSAPHPPEVTIEETTPLPIMPVPPFEPGIFEAVKGDDRRRAPRLKCFVAVELRSENFAGPVWGNLANTSVGGCLVETTIPIPSKSKLEVGLWVATGKIWVKGIVLNGIVTRSHPCYGIRGRFADLESFERESLRQFLRYVEKATKGYEAENGYVAHLKR